MKNLEIEINLIIVDILQIIQDFLLNKLLLLEIIFFENCHWRRDGRFARLDPNYAMAESWRRLSEVDGAHIEPHDMLMLQHELYEIDILLRNPKYSITMAHEIAEQKYNYSEASKKYYEQLFSRPKRKESDSKNSATTETKLRDINAFL